MVLTDRGKISDPRVRYSQGVIYDSLVTVHYAASGSRIWKLKRINLGLPDLHRADLPKQCYVQEN